MSQREQPRQEDWALEVFGFFVWDFVVVLRHLQGWSRLIRLARSRAVCLLPLSSKAIVPDSAPACGQLCVLVTDQTPFIARCHSTLPHPQQL